jgi:hypothetical protein
MTAAVGKKGDLHVYGMMGVVVDGGHKKDKGLPFGGGRRWVGKGKVERNVDEKSSQR